MFIYKKYTKCMLQFMARVFFYCWLSFLIILRSNLLLMIMCENAYGYMVIMVAIASFFAWKKYDVFIVRLVLGSKKYIYLVYLTWIVVWVQFGLEWISRPHWNNYESFMRNEPIAVLMGLPFSLVIPLFSHFYHIDDIRIDAIVLWLLYFSVSMLQLVFIIKKGSALFEARERE